MTRSSWSSRFRWDSTTIQLVGLSINTCASIIMTLRVFLLHERLRVSEDGTSTLVFNDRADAEQAMTYVCVALYFLSFFLYLWSAFLSQANRRKEFYLLEKYFGVDFSDISGVSFDDVEDFEEEKRRGYTIKKAKDVQHASAFEVHRRHTRTEL